MQSLTVGRSGDVAIGVQKSDASLTCSVCPAARGSCLPSILYCSVDVILFSTTLAPFTVSFFQSCYSLFEMIRTMLTTEVVEITVALYSSIIMFPILCSVAFILRI